MLRGIQTGRFGSVGYASPRVYSARNIRWNVGDRTRAGSPPGSDDQAAGRTGTRTREMRMRDAVCAVDGAGLLTVPRGQATTIVLCD